MADGRKNSFLWLSAVLLLFATSVCDALAQGRADTMTRRQPEALDRAPAQVNTIREVFEKLYGCWKPPPLSRATPMDITVRVSFNRSGAIMGRPRITFESPKATDDNRLAYRVAVMEALQRCTPMPFTETMAGAVAGHPFTIQFRTHLKEKQAWLLPKIL